MLVFGVKAPEAGVSSNEESVFPHVFRTASRSFYDFVRKRFDALVSVMSDENIGWFRRSEHRLYVGHDDAFAPWVGTENDGSSSGISVDIFRAAAALINEEPLFFSGPWAQISPLLGTRFLRVVLNVGYPNPYFDNFPVVGSIPYAYFERN